METMKPNGNVYEKTLKKWRKTMFLGKMAIGCRDSYHVHV